MSTNLPAHLEWLFSAVYGLTSVVAMTYQLRPTHMIIKVAALTEIEAQISNQRSAVLPFLSV